MAYCPKCGVEVENTVRKCPLCQFPIPDITEDLTELNEVNKYPEAQNIYEDYRSGIKNRILFVTVALMISTIAVLATITIVFGLDRKIVAYVVYAILSLYMYMFFLLGYLRWGINITGIMLTTLFLTYSIETISDGHWFNSYAMPITLWVYVNILVFHFLFKHSKRKKQFGYLPTFALLIVATLGLGIDGIISYNFLDRIHLTWSLIQGISSVAVALVLYTVLNHLPPHVQDTLRRKLHM